MTFARQSILLTVFICLISLSVSGQAYPTNNVILRMSMIESQYGRGSAFSIDVDKREYWITAKHIITGAEHPPYGTADMAKRVTLKLLDPGSDNERWISVSFKVLDPNQDSDIVVLAADQPIITLPIASAAFEGASFTLGGECSFLGFPFGGGWRAHFSVNEGYWMPYVKRCTISSIPGGGVLILDGINNHGFSGGPVLYETGAKQKIVAVISGYWEEPALVIPTSQKVKAPKPASQKRNAGHVNVNTGFIVAYTLDPAISAIRRSPIGPLRPDAKPQN